MSSFHIRWPHWRFWHEAAFFFFFCIVFMPVHLGEKERLARDNAGLRFWEAAEAPERNWELAGMSRSIPVTPTKK